MSRPSTLKDVAGRAGVSTATVARVLHGTGPVADETRRLVAAALAETGYQINAVAQGLRRQRTSTIGHLLHGIVPNPFFAGVALGVEQEALRHGCGVLMFNTQGDAERERLGVETLIRRRVDAILFTTAVHEENVRLAQRAAVPVVQVERMTAVDTLAVTVDNRVGACAATNLLLGLGHRRIAYVGAETSRSRTPPGGDTRPDVEQDRLSGYLDALRDGGTEADEGLIALGRYYQGTEQGNDGYVWTDRFLRHDDPPTAVFASSDILAAGALQAIYEHGLRVPDDISVVGFDDTYAPYFAPPLTTVAQPMVEIGQAAAGLVFRSLSGPGDDAGPRTERLPTRLVVRASTGPAPDRAARRVPRRPPVRLGAPVGDGAVRTNAGGGRA